MTDLRQQMIEQMKLRRFSENTQQSYVIAVKGLSKYYNKSPDEINDHQIQQYLINLSSIKKRSWSTCNVAMAGLIFFIHMYYAVHP